MTAPAGSAALTAAVPARTAAAVPAPRNRYSICAAACVPGARTRAISPGTTHPSAELVTEVATPTTVSTGRPGALVTVIFVPSGSPSCMSLDGLLARTSWPGRCAQCPDCRVTSSTGPPGEARPASVNCGSDPFGPVTLASCGVMLASAKGPAAAAAPGSRVVAASSAGAARAASTIATTCAPRCAANDWSNGALESTTRAWARAAAPTDTSSTRP